MKKHLILFSFFPLLIFAQNQGNNWYFGNNAGVKFDDGIISAVLDGQLSYPTGNGHNEGSASISDGDGFLLFYTDGETIWNKNHDVMLNGQDLLGNFSSSQSSIIVPSPADPDRYFYLFTIGSLMGETVGGSEDDGFRYSIVDMCMDNGHGGVIPDQKNILLADYVAEKIAVTRHQNGSDYWILTHKFFSDEFLAIRLSPTGIQNTVITSIGSVHEGNVYGVQGQMKFSQSGSKVAIGASNGLNILDLLDFDISTGILSNPMSLLKPNNDSASIYGIEFSPDNSKLYASGITSLGLQTPFLVQYDLESGAGELSDINESMFEVYFDTGPGLAAGKGLQLGPDGKIYWVSRTNWETLAVLHSPNENGVACDFEDQAVSLMGRNGSYSLPSFIAGYDYDNTTTACIGVGIDDDLKQNSISIGPNPTSSELTGFSSSYLRNCSFNLYNSRGELQRTFDKISGTQFTLNIDGLPTGIYLLSISDEYQFHQSTIKVVIEN